MIISTTISGSFRKFPEVLERLIERCRDLGIKVRSPQSGQILSYVNGFMSLKGDVVPDISKVAECDFGGAVNLVENSHLRSIKRSSFLWLMLPDGYFGPATAFETGYAIANSVPVYCVQREWLAAKDPIISAYVKPISQLEDVLIEDRKIWLPQKVGREIMRKAEANLPNRQDTAREQIALGCMIYKSQSKKEELPEILLVETQKWGGRLSIVGDRLQDGNPLSGAFSKIVREQTGLTAQESSVYCAFDEIPCSGYYTPGTQRRFIDRALAVDSKLVELDHRAAKAVWLNPLDALKCPNIEENARYSVKEFVKYASGRI